MRRTVGALLAVAVVGLGTLVTGGAASALGPGQTVVLGLDGTTAFDLLGHSCGGIEEQAYGTGFDPTSGFPTGDVDLKTSCGGSGRGGHGTTYTAWAGVTWDFTGTVVTASALATAPVTDPTFTATDANGNVLANPPAAIGLGSPLCLVGEVTCPYSATLTLGPRFTPTPRVTGLSATSGTAAGGTAVTITGSGFTGLTAVDFGGVPATFTFVDDNSLTVVAPASSAGTVDVTVTTAGGTSATSAADQFTYLAVPVVTGISPSSGPYTGGTPVVITGSGFTNAYLVTVGDGFATFTVVDDTTIDAVTPAAGSPDGARVTVTGPGGVSAGGRGSQFTYTAGGGDGNVSCARLSGSASSITFTTCTPASKSGRKAVATSLASGVVTWSPGGATTTYSVDSLTSSGQGLCAARSTEFDLSGTVTGGTSTYTAVGDAVAVEVCVTARGKVSLAPGTTAAL